MSRLSNRNAARPLTVMVGQLRNLMTQDGKDFASSDVTKQVTSMEGLSEPEMQNLEQSFQSLSNSIQGLYGDAMQQAKDEYKSLGFEALTDTQIEAGSMVAMAFGDPEAYARVATTSRAESGAGVSVVSVESNGAAGSLDFRDTPSMESFDRRELEEFIPYSIMFNLQASRQDEFGETFYPTTIVSPEMGGIDIKIDRITVHNPIRHEISGRVTDFSERNLVEAVSDSTVLGDESTALVPELVANNEENQEKFVSTDLVSSYVRRVHNVDITTAPLAVGVELNLLGLSSANALINAGILDHTDAIDPGMALERLYVQMPNGGSVFSFDVSEMARNAFLKSPEGGGREVTLNFPARALLLTGNKSAVDGSEPAELAPLRDNNLSARIAVTVTGSANLEFGNVEVNAGQLRVTEVLDADGEARDLSSGVGKAIVDAIRGTQVIGYTLNARRTNSNLRSQGLLINNRPEAERYHIPLGSPISAPSPIGSERDTKDLENLITAARVRNSNNAVTTLLNFAETLRAYVVNSRVDAGNITIQGAGRHMVVPYFNETSIHLPDEINSLTSHERRMDVSAVLTNVVSDRAYHMLRNSCYGSALATIDTGSKNFSLLVGTDSVIEQYLMVSGDERTFGPGFQDGKVVTSYDARMDGKIVLTFGRPELAGQPDALSFGTHAWMPELTTAVNVSVDGSHHRRATVQPRSLHINNLPIMSVINVSGIEEVMTRSVSVRTSSEDESTADTSGGDTATTDGSTNTSGGSTA